MLELNIKYYLNVNFLLAVSIHIFLFSAAFTSKVELERTRTKNSSSGLLKSAPAVKST